MKKFVHFIVTHSVLSFFISITLATVFSFGLLKLEFNFNTKAWFHKDDPNLIKLLEYEKKFGGDDYYLLLMQSQESLLSQKSFKILEELHHEVDEMREIGDFNSIKGIPLISSVEDEILVEPIDLEGKNDQEIAVLKEEIQNDKNLTGYLINKEQDTLLIVIKLKDIPNFSPNYKQVTENIYQIIEKLEKKHSSVKFYLSGQLAIQDAFGRIAGMDLKRIGIYSFSLIFLFLFLSFRSFLVALSPIIIAVISILSTVGMAGIVGIKFNNLLTLLPGIILAISCADIIHIFKSKQLFQNEADVNFKALKENFYPTLLTSITTCVGFLSFAFSKVAPIKDLGILTSFGVMFAWLMCYGISPFLLRIVTVAKLKKEKDLFDSISFFKQYKKLILLAFSLMTVISLLSLPKLNIDSSPFNSFDKDLPIYIANQKIKGAFEGNKGPVVTLFAKDVRDPEFLKKAQELEKFLLAEEKIIKVTSLLDIVRKLNFVFMKSNPDEYRIPDSKQAISQLLFLFELSQESLKELRRKADLKYETMTIEIIWNVKTAKMSKHLNEKINKKIHELGLSGQTNGKNPLFAKLNDYVVETILISIMTTSLIIAFILFIIFKDLKLSLISIIPNIFPILMASLAAVLLDIDVDVGTALVASICMGIAVDDTIHFLFHYKKTCSEALLPTINKTIRPLCWTTIVLVLGFGSFMLGDFGPNINFGILSAIVLTVALITDLVLLPTLLLKKES